MRLLMVATRIAREETRIRNPSSQDSELLLPPDKMRLLAVRFQLATNFFVTFGKIF